MAKRTETSTVRSLTEKKKSIIDKIGHRSRKTGEVTSIIPKTTTMANSSRDATTEPVTSREMTNARTSGSVESQVSITSSLTMHTRMDQTTTEVAISKSQTSQMSGLLMIEIAVQTTMQVAKK